MGRTRCSGSLVPTAHVQPPPISAPRPPVRPIDEDYYDKDAGGLLGPGRHHHHGPHPRNDTTRARLKRRRSPVGGGGDQHKRSRTVTSNLTRPTMARRTLPPQCTMPSLALLRERRSTPRRCRIFPSPRCCHPPSPSLRAYLRSCEVTVAMALPPIATPSPLQSPCKSPQYWW